MAARADLHRDIGDLQRHLFQVRGLPRHERAGATAALDHAALGQCGQHLVHRHPRAIVLLHQLVLVRNTEARRPLSAEDAAFQIAADTLVERGGLAGLHVMGSRWREASRPARPSGRRRRRW
ncbi:hypothetical protein G6F63_016292 [Rhizopus arrhizus]|nr:hypothetical protein G6F63_016292 [Rhizopus arrhizus]